MTAIIGILCEEHRNIEKLLLLLEQELRIFDRGKRPDYEILQATISYFQDFPDRCHHPKEDTVFHILKVRDLAMTAAIADIEGEHRGEASRLRRFALIVDSIQVDHEVLRRTFHDAVRGFIDYQRQHIEKEERVLFPAALNALQPEDWAAIDARLCDRKDPLFDGQVEEEFRSLRQHLLNWEEENEADRAPAAV